jgi:CTP synthase
VLEPQTLGEQKSKAAQLGIKRLMENGIQPSIVACRATSPVTQKVREKIAQFTNVPVGKVFSMHDCKSIYVIPGMLKDEGIDVEVLNMLKLKERSNPKQEAQAWDKWSRFVNKLDIVHHKVNIGIIGKYTSLRDSYASIIHALEHSGVHLSVDVEIHWIDTTEIDSTNVADKLKVLHGIIVPGGFGVRGTHGKIMCIQYARENGLPYLGICLGFQMAVIEYARNVLGLKDADSTEFNASCKHPIIDILPEQKNIKSLGGNMRLGGKDVEIKKGTMAWDLFGQVPTTRMRFRHRLEVNPKYIKQLTDGGLVFSGVAPGEDIMQVLELPGHTYFIGTQAHPCLTTRPLIPNAMYTGLVAAARQKAFPDGQHLNAVDANKKVMDDAKI